MAVKSVAKVIDSNIHEYIESNNCAILTDGITKHFLEALNVLWIFGRCPLLIRTYTYKLTDKEYGGGTKIFNFVNYEFRICKSLRFLFSLVFLFFFVSLFLFGILQLGGLNYQILGSGKLFPDMTKRWEYLSKRMGLLPWTISSTFEVIMAFQILLEYIIIWLTIRGFPVWLNAWNRIELEIANLPPRHSGNGSSLNDNLKNFIFRFKYCYICIPTTVFSFLIIYPHFNGDFPLDCLLRIAFTSCANLCTMVDEGRILLMFKALLFSFKEMHERIEERLAWDLELEEIHSWRQILRDIRHQAFLCGRNIAHHQLLSLFFSIYFEAAAFFVLTTIFGTAHYSVMVTILVIAFTLVVISRAYFKITMAASITEEERKITDLLKRSEFKTMDKECVEELRLIHTMLGAEPTEISLNDYLKLNNALLLTMTGQVLTLFIVFMQFQIPKTT